MTLSLPQVVPATGEAPARPHAAKTKRMVPLSDLQAGETGRIVRVSLADQGCRKRFAELGLAEGMKVTVASSGETMMLLIGNARMGVAARCADAITVVRV